MTQFEKEEAAKCRFFFRKENRVLRRADFQHVYSHSKPVRRSLVHVFILKHDDTPPPPTRLGIPQSRATACTRIIPAYAAAAKAGV
jgi:hypothetical protein